MTTKECLTQSIFDALKKGPKTFGELYIAIPRCKCIELSDRLEELSSSGLLNRSHHVEAYSLVEGW